MTVKMTGMKEFQRKFERVNANAPSIGRSVVVAACSTVAKACEAAAPGSIKEEVGFSVRTDGDKTTGRAGLVKFPREGDGQNGPHGVYVDQGTKFIEPRHFIGQAIASSRAAAMAAGKRAAQRRIQKLTSK